MALVKCPECGKEASSRATACPQCGCPIGASAVPAPTGDGAPNLNLATTPLPATSSRSPDFSYIFKCVCAVVGSLFILALIGYGCWKFFFGVTQAANNAHQAMKQRSVEQEIAAVQTQLAAFKTALDAYEMDSGHYPKTLMDLIQQPQDAQYWHGPYLQTNAVPKDPWGSDYVYKCPGWHNPTSYDVSSPGPPGSNMVIGNWTTRR